MGHPVNIPLPKNVLGQTLTDRSYQSNMADMDMMPMTNEIRADTSL